MDGAEARLIGTISGAGGATLENLDIVAPEGNATLLDLDNGAMRLHKVRFIGSADDRSATGILATCTVLRTP